MPSPGTAAPQAAGAEHALRILHVVPTYVPAWRYGGPIRSVHGLAKAQARAGDRVSVFTTDRDGEGRLSVPAGEEVIVDGVTVRYFRAGSPARLGVSRDLGAALRAEIGTFDVVHLHAVFQYSTLVGARAAARAGTPYIVSPRGMLVPELVERRGEVRKKAWIRLFERRTLAGASALVATSDAEARDLERIGLALAPVAVVPNGVDSSGDEEPSAGGHRVASLPTDRPLVVYLGRISWKKGLDRLLAAVARVESAHLAIAGTDDEGLAASLRTLASELGLAERTSFLGEVRGGAKRELLGRAAVFVLPSISENFGIAALEAMAAAVPVVVTRGVGLASEVESSNCGVVSGESAGDLAAAIDKVLSDPSRARAMGLRGREAAARGYTWDAIAGRMRIIYLRVLRVRRDAAGAVSGAPSERGA